MTNRNTSSARPVSDIITGPYLSLEALLRLRHRPFRQGASGRFQIGGSRAGQRLSSSKGRGIDFAEVRQYQPGDDVRTIDWRVTARKNAPHTKLFREEREHPALILVDQNQHMFFGSIQRLKSVAAGELAARIAWQVTTVGDRVGGMVVSNGREQLFKPVQTQKAVARFLAAIATANQNLNRLPPQRGPASSASALSKFRQLAGARYRIFVISDFSGPISAWQDQLLPLAQDHLIRLLHIVDPLDAELPPANQYAISSAGRRHQFNSGDDSLRRRYRGVFEERVQALKSLEGRLTYTSLSTADPHWDHHAWTS